MTAQHALELVLAIAYWSEAEDVARDGCTCADPDEETLASLILRLQRHLREQRLGATSPAILIERRLRQVTEWSLAVEHALVEQRPVLERETERAAEQLEVARTKLLMSATADLLADLGARVERARDPIASGPGLARMVARDVVAAWRDGLHRELADDAAAMWLEFASAVQAALPLTTFTLAPPTAADVALDFPPARIELEAPSGARWSDRVRSRTRRTELAVRAASDELVRALGHRSRELVLDYVQLLARRGELVIHRLRRSARELERSTRQALERSRRLETTGDTARIRLLGQLDGALGRLVQLERSLVAN